jgi:hypothetical protein
MCNFAPLLCPFLCQGYAIGKGVVPWSIFGFPFSVQRRLYVSNFQMLHTAALLAGN